MVNSRVVVVLFPEPCGQNQLIIPAIFSSFCLPQVRNKVSFFSHVDNKSTLLLLHYDIVSIYKTLIMIKAKST